MIASQNYNFFICNKYVHSVSELVGTLDEQSKFSYELYQSYFYLSRTISGVFPNPKLSVLFDLSPSFGFAWSHLTLSHCSVGA